MLEGSHLYFEELDCHRENLQFHVLQEKLSQTLRIENLTDDILRTLGFFTAQGKYNNAAAIFADKMTFMVSTLPALASLSMKLWIAKLSRGSLF